MALWYRSNDDGMYQVGFRIFDGDGETHIFADTFTEMAAMEIVDTVNIIRKKLGTAVAPCDCIILKGWRCAAHRGP